MPAIVPNHLGDDDDDWETDPDYVNTMSEEQQRWGGARDTGVLDMDKFREEVKQEHINETKKRQEADGYKSSTGYGGKFGVLSDRQDKSAVGWSHVEKVSSSSILLSDPLLTPLCRLINTTRRRITKRDSVASSEFRATEWTRVL